MEFRRINAEREERGESVYANPREVVDVVGTLTIKGRSKPVVFSGRYRGIARDQEGRPRIAFQATGMVDRREFGMDWNESVAGTDLVGNDVEITIGIEAVRID